MKNVALFFCHFFKWVNLAFQQEVRDLRLKKFGDNGVGLCDYMKLNRNRDLKRFI